MTPKSLIPAERIEKSILLMRGRKIMLDADLAELYGVSTKRLNEQVRRNKERFPADFMFQLSEREFKQLRSQFATTKFSMRRNPPYAFTEHGAVMLASVLNSDVAIHASIQVVKAFVRLRSILKSHEELSRKLDELEGKYKTHDRQIAGVFEALRQLMAPPAENAKRIGFRKE